ncbi:MAG: GtrA family protein [Burkholderiaceae bacterium]|nr:GtrA family protein [Burkholderiaceae bacterium]
MSPATGWRDWIVRFVLHVATGVLAVVAHYAVMALCIRASVAPVAASAIGFVAGALTRFYTAYFHVYSPTTTARAVAPRFVLALAAQFVANAALLGVLMAAGVPVWWAQVITTALLAVATYLVYRLLVFV